jgi:hypothetical protein
LVKPIAIIYSQGLYRNLFYIFLSFISFSMHFRILNEFIEFIIENQNPRKEKMSEIWSTTSLRRSGSVAKLSGRPMPTAQWARTLGAVTAPGAGAADAGLPTAPGRLGL